jgi:ArsR family transcriptional regulator
MRIQYCIMKDTARLFKALADETRLRILALLTRGELCVCDIMDVLSLPQSTVSRHLAYLRNTGWVDDRRQGVWMYYKLAHGRGALHRDMLTILKEHLEKIPAVQNDLAAFKAHIETKRASLCK